MSGLLDGVLPWIFSQGDTMKRNLRGNVRSLLEDPRGYAQSIGQDIAAENTRRSQAAKALLYPSVMDEQGQQQAMQAMTETALNLLAPTVYHGSPHKFSKFDSSKIGTGEGAQAYGHGLYFADNRSVAESYKDTDPAGIGKWIRENRPDLVKRATASLESYNKTHTLPRVNPFTGVDRTVQPVIDDAAIGRWAIGENIPDLGNLYKVDLPDSMIAKMLDWDKPLSQQPESVRKAIEPIINEHINRAFVDGINGNTLESAKHWNPWLRTWIDNPSKATGEDVYRIMKSGAYPGYAGTQQAASESIGKAGITGIRYLDAGSRGAGKGSYNYVVFPGGESQLKILERNGKGLLDR